MRVRISGPWASAKFMRPGDGRCELILMRASFRRRESSSNLVAARSNSVHAARYFRVCLVCFKGERNEDEILRSGKPGPGIATLR